MGGDQGEHAQSHERQLAAQVAEEGVARPDAHGVAEQAQAQAAQEAQVRAEPGVERTDCKAHEERTGRAEADGAKGDLAHSRSQSDDEEDGQDGSGSQDVDHGEQEVGHAPQGIGSCTGRA